MLHIEDEVLIGWLGFGTICPSDLTHRNRFKKITTKDKCLHSNDYESLDIFVALVFKLHCLYEIFLTPFDDSLMSLLLVFLFIFHITLCTNLASSVIKYCQ